MLNASQVKLHLINAVRSVVPAVRGCIYSVANDLTPYGHAVDSRDDSWIQIYPRYRDFDPFHPRHFADRPESVYRTCDGGVDSDEMAVFVDRFRQPMGVAYKAEVFLRNESGAIVGGIRLSRPKNMGEFTDQEVSSLVALQPTLSLAWRAASADEDFLEATSLLTPREKEVLNCLRRGQCNKEIQRELGLALPTTKTHLRNIMRKFGVSTRVELLAKLTGLSR